MNKTTLALLASFGVNVVLLGLIIMRPAAGPEIPSALRKAGQAQTAQTGSGGQGQSIGSAASSAEASAARGTGSPVVAAGPAAEKWQQLVSGDLHALVAKLRASGFSETMIRSIVSKMLDAQFGARLREIYGITGELQPFWTPEASRGAMNAAMNTPEKRQAILDLQKERSDLEKELLGSAVSQVANNPAALVALRSQYGNLSAEKIGAINQAMMDLSQAQSQLMTRISGQQISPEDRATLNGFPKERENAIAAILSPSEYQEYQLRSSPTATQLRNELVAFNPSEEEYKAIYGMQKAFDDQYATGLGMTAETARARMQALPGLREQIAEMLGPERGNDYRISMEPGSAQISRVVTRLELPVSTVADVLAVQKDIQARAATVRNNRDLTPAARTQQIAALQDEATNRLGATLGQRGLDAYKISGGAWVDNLAPAARGGSAPVPLAPVLVR